MEEAAVPSRTPEPSRDDLADVRQAYRDGRWQDAERLLQVLLARDEAVPILHLLMGRIHDHQERTRLAARHYRRALELEPQFVESRLLLGLLHGREGRRSKAQHELGTVLQQRPDYQPALLAMAAIFEAQQDSRSAVPLLQRAVEQDPGDLNTLRRLFAALSNLADRPTKRLTLERLLAISPHRAVVLFQLAFVAQEEGDWERAFALLRGVVAAAPASVEGHVHLAYVAEVLGRWADVADHYGHAVLLEPEHADWWAKRAAALVRIDRLQEAEASYREAEASYRAAATRAPADYGIWKALWTVRRQSGDAAGAVEAGTRALALGPGSRDDQLQMVSDLHAADRSAEALESCRAVAASDVQDVSWDAFMDAVKSFIRVPPRRLPQDATKSWEYFHYNRDKVLAMMDAALTIRHRFPHTPRVFLGQGLIAWEKTMGFLEDARFLQSTRKYDHLRMMVNWEWNLHVIHWAAAHALHVPGDFVELGVFRGYTTAVTAEILDFGQRPKRWFLYDTFAGIPADQQTDGWPHAYDGMESDAWYREVVTLFAPYRNIEVIRGRVPEVFETRCPEVIAFLHIDLNSAAAEIGALEALYERLSPGAVIVFDDYGWFTAREQFDAENAWMRERELSILELPTGQGLFVKPGPSRSRP